MDAERFDLVSQLVGPAGTRRRLFGALAAGAISTTLTLVEAEARRKKKKKKTKTCTQGTVRCGKQCVNFASDRSNCGSCGNRCRSHEPTCVNGECTPNTCPADSLICAVQNVICGDTCVCGSRLDGSAFCADCAFCNNPECETDADCVALGLPQGTVCGKGGGGDCDECPGTSNLCLTPCGSCSLCSCL